MTEMYADCPDEKHDIDEDDYNGDIHDGEITGADRSYTIRDYFDIRIDELTGQLRNTVACPRGDTQCDGFVFDSIQDCLDHERDWHSGPYKCFICGQIFASGPRLRRHDHYTDSEERKAEVEAAETRKNACCGVKIYHGNEWARRRAKLLLKKIKLEEAAQDKKRDRKIMGDVKKEMAKKRKRDGPLVVIGVAGRTVMGEVEDEKGGGNCDEPCCPAFERRFVNDKAHQRHVASQGHVAAMRMGAALLEQLTITAGFKTSLTETPSRRTNVDMSGRGHDRDTTPPPSRLVDNAPTQQLLSPPATPHGPSSSSLLSLSSSSRDEEETSWDSMEHIPLRLERRLALTQQALRELRCNAPGCGMYGKQMASSQSYWGHLASEGHVKALKTWSERGGEAVYVYV
ncbi:uncharacterized protein BBA_03984 [Beauveria bassiana ARSEF 2860]|uniref:C2H2-type domain-containing protein n=1 Tax=Beauveria bassiana (strain ARSEF 2860) TaxID=655819 RepID=J4WBB7_BEAB2|nr:uncharacterized protein BBA_03984 [Beauveria bassiana ARSEF 2860]EJP67410.1 hypothetical protein BBA_03984 [Beauveria bassiana ARSEF 2860]